MPKTDVGAGCAVVVFNEKKQFLMLHRRKDVKHAPDTWCLPGGWIEKFEELEIAAARETLEETGVLVRNVKVMGVQNNIRRNEDHHTITVIMAAVMRDGSPAPTNAEPDKADAVRWIDDWNNMPAPTFSAYSAAVSRETLEKYLSENL
ncbi:MAG: NUDIX domain-containing protein [Rickettsiales bacterium]|jgi:8-oxo-dGTP diphosphatase|nr:NUDIX domain-containing protein [Rickettsiales bacterium]